MTKREEVIVLYAVYWPDRRLSAGQWIAATHRFLKRLAELSPAFADPKWEGHGGSVVLPSDPEQYEARAMEYLRNPRDRYENPGGSDRSFTSGSAISRGYVMVAKFADPRVGMSLRAGGYELGRTPNRVVLEVMPGLEEFRRNDGRARQLLGLMAEIWEPVFGVCTNHEVAEALDQQLDHVNFGAINYFSDARAGDRVMHSELVAPAAHGGVFVYTPSVSLTATDPMALRPAFKRLLAAGLLHWGRNKHA